MREAIFTPSNVAVVTGAALGIGRALSIRLSQRGMSVVMADLESNDFDEAVEAAQSVALDGKTAVLGVATDVSNSEQIDALKAQALATFGKVNFLANNAVTRIGRGFDADIDDWRRLMEVNLWGPIISTRAFLPALLENPEPSAIVNAGSKQGITNPPGHPAYNISKSALKTYTESLQHELRNQPNNLGEARTSAHLLIPGWTTTGKSEHKDGAWLPGQVVDMMLAGVSNDTFYIVCPDDEVTTDMDHRRILWAAEDITQNRPPLSRWHPDFADTAKAACS